MMRTPLCFGATLKIPLPENPGNTVDAMFNCLADFINATIEEEKHFVVFPYKLSNYKMVTDLPPVDVNVDGLPNEVNDWL